MKKNVYFSKKQVQIILTENRNRDRTYQKKKKMWIFWNVPWAHELWNAIMKDVSIEKTHKDDTDTVTV